MAKEIKFNLIIDGQAVRDIEGLKNSFNLDDILKYFKNGILERWLKVRNLDLYLNRLKTIDKTKNIVEIAKNILQVFEMKNIGDEVIYHIEFLKNRETDLDRISKTEIKTKSILENYHKRYKTLKENIDDSSNNLQYLKEAVNEIEREFYPLFKLEYTELLNRYLKDNILMMVAILMNRKLRKYILDNRDIRLKLSSIISIRDEMIKNVYSQYKSFRGLEPKLKDSVIIYKGDSSQKWINLETEDILILQSNAGTKLRDIYNSEKEISHIYAKGLIMQGLEFQSFKETHFVAYIPLKDIRGFVGEISIFRGETDGYWKDIEKPEIKQILEG